ncbi:protein unc-93 homolog A-like [Bacillus rossius redtenbacheri]|uniref:protein unc-93 homolog A-like n=1 Tax=Bacillus rossius redtenbacheri TaxID=93214 RepID=UPI002FDC7F6C
MAVAALWAVAGSVWLVHLNAQCGRLFPGEEEAGFSNFRLWDAVGFILVSGYSNFVCMRAKLYIQLVGVLLGAASYLLLEGSRLRAGASRSFEVSG